MIRAWSAILSIGITVVTSTAHGEASSLPPEVGYNRAEVETPRSLALGGAARALGIAETALALNPANMAASRVYHVAGLAQLYPEAGRQSWGAGLVDSVSNSQRIAGGLGATWSTQDPSGIERTALDLRLGLAFPFSDKVFAGVAGRYIQIDQKGTGPFGRSLASGGLANDNIMRTITFDAGLSFRPQQEIGIGVVGYNLTNSDSGLLPLMVGGGAGYGTKDFTIEANILADFTTYMQTSIVAMGGGELLIGDHFPLRLGYRYDTGATSHGISAGFGYIDRQFSLEAGVRRVVSSPASTAIVIGLKLHLEAFNSASGEGG